MSKLKLCKPSVVIYGDERSGIVKPSKAGELGSSFTAHCWYDEYVAGGPLEDEAVVRKPFEAADI